MKIVKLETMVFVTANEIGLAEIVINATFRKMHFSGIVIFAW